ncbi:MAG: ribose-phosphate pyrophosphokinase [Ignavibacteria bacterium RIFOXYB2_FULL_35_12]|nr:MAG: ribose-phosphate pyrophosphokinase [Ignavibacteria bacterium GWA2_36_19]OGU49906.1 MAG: ribose-phosphate pyrophosphokinase [Ignavibacteria bacterium GWC2_35_8]OGU57438.1 MAG: ribose-phosphate pyrophosphokinase [Ignavibacteria bacterium GWF2_35_20]OGU83577.1 MAG: ribose-phosphate pyrophosphokinase [Ignavibacteria bacterium RIFOXYA2_FULL_35_9]OGU88375.1 MAG: ribose-phosphate pyrophosphokinase [Ignavibacteria bacterium RIFOXYC12_FULL_35_11]OGU91554.1 MAG: ribose-phosphate pyrophosphokinas
MATENLKIFSGSSNLPLAEKIARKSNMPLGLVELKRFSDGEIWVKYLENIRGSDIFIVQSTNPPAENLIELLIMVDAAKRASANRITAVIPYFGYSRQDRKDQPRVSITAKLLANLITGAGADRVITMDLHAAQIQGFFDIPFDHLYGSSIFSGLFNDIKDNLVVVSPDVGGIKIARSYAKRLNASLVVIDKRRPKQNLAEVVHIIGSVKDKDVLIVDDLIDTAGTFVGAIDALKKEGAQNIYGAVTHPLFSGPAIERIRNSQITNLLVSDTINFKHSGNLEKISVVSAAEIFAEAIIRTHDNESISSLFDVDKG